VQNMISVLIVDDDTASQASFTQILTQERCSVVSAFNCRDAILEAQQRTFDVVILELNLPDISGLEFMRACRRRCVSVGALAVVTRAATVATAVAALKLGATEYVEKPISRIQLLELVCAGAERAEGSAANHGPPCVRAETPWRGGVVNDSRVRRALAIIEERYTDQRLTVRTAAKELGIATEYLCRIVKQHTGLTFGRALDRHRLEHAQRLLRETPLTCKEIAVNVGFGSTARLDRHFQKHLKSTPTAFRHSRDWQ
jgi:YesN/AraC family two-component response regulator